MYAIVMQLIVSLVLTLSINISYLFSFGALTSRTHALEICYHGEMWRKDFVEWGGLVGAAGRGFLKDVL